MDHQFPVPSASSNFDNLPYSSYPSDVNYLAYPQIGMQIFLTDEPVSIGFGVLNAPSGQPIPNAQTNESILAMLTSGPSSVKSRTWSTSPPTQGTVAMADIYNPPPVVVHNFDGEVSDQEDEDKEPEMEGIQVTDIDTSGYYMASRRTINDDPFMVPKPAQQHPSRAANTSASTKTSKKYQPYQVALRFRPSRLATEISDAPVNERSPRPRKPGAAKQVSAKRNSGRIECPNGCGKTFSRAYDAHRHAKKTLVCGGGQKSFSCLTCDSRYVREDALMRHHRSGCKKT